MENRHMANSAKEQMLKLSFIAIYLNVALMTSRDCDHCVGWSAPVGRSPHQLHCSAGREAAHPAAPSLGELAPLTCPRGGLSRRCVSRRL